MLICFYVLVFKTFILIKNYFLDLFRKLSQRKKEILLLFTWFPNLQKTIYSVHRENQKQHKMLQKFNLIPFLILIFSKQFICFFLQRKLQQVWHLTHCQGCSFSLVPIILEVLIMYFSSQLTFTFILQIRVYTLKINLIVIISVINVTIIDFLPVVLC